MSTHDLSLLKTGRCERSVKCWRTPAEMSLFGSRKRRRDRKVEGFGGEDWSCESEG